MSVEEVMSFRKESLTSSLPNVEEASVDADGPRTQLLRLLDEIESRVERFRRGALIWEEERDLLSTSIDAIRTSELMNTLLESEKEEIIHYVDRVQSRCSTVEIRVNTVRNEMQEESLNRVNTFIDTLVVDLHGDPMIVKERCMSYMAACVSNADDHVDKTFETAVLGCSLDDQKRVRRRLQGLMNYIDHAFNISLAED